MFECRTQWTRRLKSKNVLFHTVACTIGTGGLDNDDVVRRLKSFEYKVTYS